jgi:hypothetical protein
VEQKLCGRADACFSNFSQIFQDALLNWKEIVCLAQEKVGELGKMLTQLKNVGLTQENVCITFENCVPNSRKCQSNLGKCQLAHLNQENCWSNSGKC